MQPRQNDEVAFSGIWAGKVPEMTRSRQNGAEDVCGGAGKGCYGKYECLTESGKVAIRLLFDNG